MATCATLLARETGKPLVLTNHAVRRLRERTGIDVRRTEARAAVMRAVKLTPDQLVLLGCGTKDRARKDGARALCFLADVRGTPVVAIVICPPPGGEATWVTTLDVPETGRAWKADPFAVVRFRGTRREKAKLRRSGGFGLRAGRAAGRRSPEAAAAGVRGANEGIRTRIGSLGANGARTA